MQPCEPKSWHYYYSLLHTWASVVWIMSRFFPRLHCGLYHRAATDYSWISSINLWAFLVIPAWPFDSCCWWGVCIGWCSLCAGFEIRLLSGSRCFVNSCCCFLSAGAFCLRCSVHQWFLSFSGHSKFLSYWLSSLFVQCRWFVFPYFSGLKVTFFSPVDSPVSSFTTIYWWTINLAEHPGATRNTSQPNSAELYVV